MAALSGFLIFVAFFALVVAVIGLVRQRVVWTRVIATRRDAGVLLGLSLVLMTVGGAMSPAPAEKVSATTASKSAAASPPTQTSSVPALVAPPKPTQPVSVPAPRTEPTLAPTTVAAPAPARTAPAPVYTPTRRAYTAPPAPTYSPPSVASEPTTGAYNGGGSTDTYTNVDGNQVERPDSSSAGASAKCNDGSYSHSQHRSGTCSGHGGVDQWL
jgi:hypothetical protein